MEDTLGLKGILALYELPHDMTNEELRYWWEPETTLGEDGLYHLVRPSRISEAEKARRKVLEVENLITNAGVKQLLNNLSAPGQGLELVFAQIFSVGNGACTGVTRADTSVVGDGFGTNSRKQPASFNVLGFTVTVTMNYASGDAQSTWTNCGLYGVNATTGANATTSTGTGQLNTHALFPFSKGAAAYTVTYTFSLAN